jgi:transcriptional regulator with XRE-family HTH domain
LALKDNLRRQRLEHAYTQKELAEAAGISLRTLARIERGGDIPSLPTLRALATALGVKPTELASFHEIEEMAERKLPDQKKAAA